MSLVCEWTRGDLKRCISRQPVKVRKEFDWCVCGVSVKVGLGGLGFRGFRV